jgi:hypothetical protein
MDRPEIARQIRQDKYGKIKTDEEQNYRDDKVFGYKLFVTIIIPSILRLHWRHLNRLIDVL